MRVTEHQRFWEVRHYLDKIRRETYYASLTWKRLVAKKEEQCNGTCERCGLRPMEQVHHLTYDRLYHEQLEDLEALCGPCHCEVHGISFTPVYVV
jgi:5-methylcytosine-specific restriction endonuclease McrA